MGFSQLLGNDRLKQNLTATLARGRLSHFYLISGPEGAGKHTLARLLAAAALCQGQEKPCMTCSHCRKVLSGSHPDVITVDDPEKKSVPVDLVRQAREDMFVRPNEAAHKIYVFPRAHDMRVEAQNALLKILEEPPSYGMFFLLTENAQRMLPTVRSRCTELALLPLPEAILRQRLEQLYPNASQSQLTGVIGRSGGYLGQAIQLLTQSEDATKTTAAFLQAYTQGNTLALTELLAGMEKWKRDALIRELDRWIRSLSNALTARSGLPCVMPMAAEISAARSGETILNAITALQKAVAYAQSNVSVGAICGYLTWALR